MPSDSFLALAFNLCCYLQFDWFIQNSMWHCTWLCSDDFDLLIIVNGFAFMCFMNSAVDGLLKCEKWIRDDDSNTEESKATWWLSRLLSRPKKVTVDWPFPFAEDKLFVLTLSSGLEGYHVNVDGRHVTSFPYRTVSAIL